MTRLAVHAFADGEPQAQALAAELGAPYARVNSHRFPDGELLVTVPDTPATVVVYQSLDQPNEKLIALALAAEAWRRLGARRLVLAAPYLAYMRQDRAFAAGQAISQKVLGDLLARLFDRIVTVNAHLHRTHRLADLFGPVPAENLSAGELIGERLKAESPATDLVVGPDAESWPLAASVARRVGAPWATLAKRRCGDASVRVTVSDPDLVRGRNVVVVDDICSTGATLMAAARQLRDLGARQLRAITIHALYDEPTAAGLRGAGFTRLESTDSVRHPTNGFRLAPLLARALTDEVIP